jgi:6-phospho-beta-glucosidase
MQAAPSERDEVTEHAPSDFHKLHPTVTRPLGPEPLGLVRHAPAYERQTAEAAVTRDRRSARLSLLAHPLIGQYDIADAPPERLPQSRAAHAGGLT